MALPTQVKEQIAESKRITDAINAGSELDKSDPPETVLEPAQLATEEIPAIEKAEQTEDWEKRFKGYKAATDATLHQLRVEIQSLGDKDKQSQQEISNLQDQLKNPKAPVNMQDIVANAMSEEERELLGDDALSAMANGMNALIEQATAPLQKQLGALQTGDQERQQQHEATQTEQRNTERRNDFATRLGTVLPDWQEIDKNPEFLGWMENIDQLTGIPRKNLYQQAFDGGDVGRIASFYGDWKRLNGGRSAEALAAPKSQGAAVIPTGKSTQTYTNAGIAKFYQDRREGKYSAEDASAIERDIALATKEGRIR